LEHGTLKAGQNNGNSRLSEDDVIAILSAEGVSQSQLAKRYGVTQALVSKIRRREMWKHL
jgi:DNA-binding transcriptional regulator YiaG